MVAIRHKLLVDRISRAYALTDYNLLNTIEKRHNFRKQIIHDDKFLTKDEKSEAIQLLNKDYDYNKLLYDKGEKRDCYSCEQKCLATLYCECCVRNFLKSNFSNWSSGRDEIDKLIQKCQMKSLAEDRIIEWIPYHKLRNIKYLTKGGISRIYTAEWIDGSYRKWDPERKCLKRLGPQKVILKKLENVESANRSWFDEARSHLTISNRWIEIVQCHGLTQDPSNDDFFLVMFQMDYNLRTYLKENHRNLTWKERIQITMDVINALDSIHREGAIHRDLHSGNILYSEYFKLWYVSDFGFCGPVNEPIEEVYGRLPYVAPEVIEHEKHDFATDIYSIGMLMWEISSGRSPFDYCDHDYHLAMRIVNGNRPKIIPGTPPAYADLMKQCWNADPEKRPKMEDLWIKIREIGRVYYKDETNEPQETSPSCYLQVPRSNPVSRSIKIYLKSRSITEELRKRLLKVLSSNSDVQSYYKSKHSINFNNKSANLHSEEQNRLEIPSDKLLFTRLCEAVSFFCNII